jgi:ACR3 family arsenite efflux pump ArsB
VRPFVEAFLLLIVVPMVLAVITTSLARRSSVVNAWNDAWAWLPVPAMAAVLFVVIGSQITAVVRDISLLLPVIPVYVGFVLLAPLMGMFAARLFALPAVTARAVTFSAATRNSLVVLPLALALPERRARVGGDGGDPANPGRVDWRVDLRSPDPDVGVGAQIGRGT